MVVIRITSNYSKFANKLFGPFGSEEEAAQELRGKGWIENVNGEKGNWFGNISRYTGINAVIENIPLCDPKNLPNRLGH